MRPERPADDEPVMPASEGGSARVYSLAFVCVLGLMAGGAAAFGLYHTGQGAAEVRGVAGERPDAGAAAAESPASEDAPTGGEKALAADTAADEVEAGAVAASRRIGRRGPEVRGRAGSGEHDARMTRRDARAPGRQPAAGGRGVGGYALGGVKKTGEGVKKTGAAIGKTVGKIGGIFHD